MGGGVVEHDGAVDARQKAIGRRLIVGDDGVGVVGAVSLDVVDSFLDAVDHLRRDDGVEIFGRPVPLGRRCDAGNHGAALLVAPNDAAGLLQRDDQGLQIVAATVRSTSSVSAGPETPVRRILALTTIFLAISRSAARST